MSKASKLVEEFVKECKNHGFIVTRATNVVTIQRVFTPGDKKIFGITKELKNGALHSHVGVGREF